MIDIWSSKNNDSYFSSKDDELKEAFKIVVNKFSQNKKVEIIMACSVDASRLFQDNFLDMAYVDANHEYPHPKNDIVSWLPKIKDGGIISGHDFDVDGEFNWGVERAVREVFGKDFKITDEEKFKSWYHVNYPRLKAKACTVMYNEKE